MFQQTFQNQNPQTINETLKLRDELMKSGTILELSQRLKESNIKEEKVELQSKITKNCIFDIYNIFSFS